MTSRDRSILRSFYEAEAQQRRRTDPTGIRTEMRDDFVEILAREGRHSVIDFGSGPGHDGAAFVERGLFVVGIDLATGNAALARERGVVVIPGSVMEPPVRCGSFDAGWSMSTLMHMDDDDAAAAIAAMARTLRPGAPLWIGVWGGEGTEVVDSATIPGHRRPFRLRTLERNRRLLCKGLDVDDVAVNDIGPSDQQYQFFRLRIRA